MTVPYARSILALAVALAAGTVTPAFAAGPINSTAEKMTGEAIKSTWFDGKPLIATAPDKTAYKMVFTQDGKSTKVQIGKKGGVVGGFWRVIAEGYCVRWTGAVREKCFNVRQEGEVTVVRFGTQIVANWTR